MAGSKGSFLQVALRNRQDQPTHTQASRQRQYILQHTITMGKHGQTPEGTPCLFVCLRNKLFNKNTLPKQIEVQLAGNMHHAHLPGPEHKLPLRTSTNLSKTKGKRAKILQSHDPTAVQARSVRMDNSFWILALSSSSCSQVYAARQVPRPCQGSSF